MNNRHEFRVWNGAEWVYPKEFELDDLVEFSQVYKFQQFTGSLDKQGNKIFEGDVVLWFGEDPFDATPSSRKMIVGWNQRVMGYRLYEWANQGGGEHFFAEDCRVIGNVFDWQNPECLYQLDKSVKHLGEERLANSLINNE